MLHVSIKAEELFNIFGFSVTNSLLASFITVLLFILVGLYFSRNADSKSKPIFFIRFVLMQLYKAFEPILGHLTPKIFPFIASLFLFILMSNWLGLLPGFGSITYTKPVIADEHVEEVNHVDETTTEDNKGTDALEEGDHDVVAKTDEHEESDSEGHAAPIPILRGATADLNMTIALGILAFLVIQYYGFRELGVGYISKFITFKGPIDFFTGILELISEFSKIISFAFRLFGNVYAGEVLLAVIAFLVPVLASFPFLLLEVFVGFIQALVFAMLTSVFINSATAKHH